MWRIDMEELNGILENSFPDKKQPVEASSEELEGNKYFLKGNTIAIVYLKGKVDDLPAEIYRHDTSYWPYLTRGVLETLVRNISIPRDT
jgi:hypothetical protein